MTKERMRVDRTILRVKKDLAAIEDLLTRPQKGAARKLESLRHRLMKSNVDAEEALLFLVNSFRSE